MDAAESIREVMGWQQTSPASASELLGFEAGEVAMTIVEETMSLFRACVAEVRRGDHDEALEWFGTQGFVCFTAGVLFGKTASGGEVPG